MLRGGLGIMLALGLVVPGAAAAPLPPGADPLPGAAGGAAGDVAGATVAYATNTHVILGDALAQAVSGPSQGSLVVPIGAVAGVAEGTGAYGKGLVRTADALGTAALVAAATFATHVVHQASDAFSRALADADGLAGSAAQQAGEASQALCNTAGGAAASALQGGSPCHSASVGGQALAAAQGGGPLPAGWEERVLLRQAFAVQGPGTAWEGAALDLLRVTGTPRGSSYDLAIHVLGEPKPGLTVLAPPGALPPFEVALLRLGPAAVAPQGASVEVVVSYRHDPGQVVCAAMVAGACLQRLPLDPSQPAWALQGAPASLVVEARADTPAGLVVRTFHVPFAGQALGVAG